MMKPARSAAARHTVTIAVALVVGGCTPPVNHKLHDRVNNLEHDLRNCNNQRVAQQATIDELRQQLAVARSINEDDIKRLFYPERLLIDPLTGGADYDDQPGDDGVTVYLKPIDRYGDVVKVAGDIRIQLFDLAAPADRNLVGEYAIPVDQVGELWHGKLWTGHFTIKCGWLHGPPEHNEITVRAIFVDYLTKRVVSAQTTCTVDLPPR